ncbi:prepilin-type N-terminal cleavage/methylation domain-containing protein [Oceanicoccus sp. KOV_DT_Chl]|uniref:prepilin-type N-terminal cleavage/methylation domain-containing protein n=1 Tax=Oceanicoccus sp. KOV_DT_Chl TaxID=1904639 RepID=UPI000C7D67C9|nr:prepilin-type N-terminal cleavage/methylation domain-containing protein [Oceanicoccus sp. KOV_DT_Chl]
MNKPKGFSANLAAPRQIQGFTLIELVIVIILLGLLAAAALPRLLSATDNAEVASLEGVAGGFSTGVSIAHAQWAADGNTAGGNTSAANKIAINLDGKVFYMNEYGWPANVNSSEDASADGQTADECKQIFDDILQSSPAATTNNNNRANNRFYVSVITGAGGDIAGQVGDVCRYELILSNSATATGTHYFDYDVVDGQVTVVFPNQG